jgi:hypothetical protein
MRAVVKGASSILAHTPDLVPLGSKPTTEFQKREGLYEECIAHLRGYREAVAYPPNQVFIGNVRPDALAGLEKPWYEHPTTDAPREGPYGELVPEDEFYGLLKAADVFDLVWLEEGFLSSVRGELRKHPLLDALEGLDGGRSFSEIKEKVDRGEALPLNFNGGVVGCVRRAHEEDAALRARVILEGLATKALAFLALRHLLGRVSPTDPQDIDYLLSFSEEAVGDRYQRGGGNLARATAEMAGCVNASGVDVKGFCCGASHAIISAAALVQAGIFSEIALVGGGSLAKLGMNFQPHVRQDMPILEDVLAAIAILVGEDDGVSPVIRTDAIGMHRIGTGSSAREIYEEVVVKPLDKLGKRIIDVDKYATQMHNPEITVPARRPDAPSINYRALGALAVLRGEIGRGEIDDFVSKHGMPGFSPTQGHVPEAIPFMGHARDMIVGGEMGNAMFVAKASVFLARMTNLSDAVSFVLERNPGMTGPSGILGGRR